MNTYRYEGTITSDQLDAILNSAFAVTGYWIESVDLPHFEKPMRLIEILEVGKNFEITEIGEDEFETLTMEKLLHGLSLYIQSGGGTDFDHFDMYANDQILQYALFGKLVYS